VREAGLGMGFRRSRTPTYTPAERIWRGGGSLLGHAPLSVEFAQRGKLVVFGITFIATLLFQQLVETVGPILLSKLRLKRGDDIE
jgi:hypothetical protein